MTIISRIIIICKFRLIQIFMYHVLSSKNIPNKLNSIGSEYIMVTFFGKKVLQVGKQPTYNNQDE